ncbi:MAG: hypothetical protein DCC67_15935 [Planctomycetota bacterium]|nr:MAG: hypothetical protein DCC67_15935 [Planctomycetota bacterium]
MDPLAHAPLFTTTGGNGVSGTTTRQPGEVVISAGSVLLAANRPTHVAMWLNSVVGSISARLADGSARLATIDFTTPTKVEFNVTSMKTQQLHFTTGGIVGLWATTLGSVVREPSAHVLAAIAVIVLRCAWRDRRMPRKRRVAAQQRQMIAC